MNKLKSKTAYTLAVVCFFIYMILMQSVGSSVMSDVVVILAIAFLAVGVFKKKGEQK